MLNGTQMEALVPVVDSYLETQRQIKALNVTLQESKDTLKEYLEDMPNEVIEIGEHTIKLETFDVERLKSSKDTRTVIRSYLPKRLSEKFFSTSTTERVVVKE